MLKRMRTVLLSVLLCLLLSALGCGTRGEAAAETYDFSELAANGLPLGWTVVSYENQYHAAVQGEVLTLSSEIADDLRLVHSVPVEGNTRYVLSGEIRTESVSGGQGASLSVDNYRLDGSYLYSESLHGNHDWTPIELAFITDAGQDTAELALRMGGYSSVSSGTVQFRNISFEESDYASVSFQRLTPSKSGADDSAASRSAEDYENAFSAFFWVMVLVAVALIFGVYRNRNSLLSAQWLQTKVWSRFAWIVLIGFVIRFLLCACFGGHASDMGCWISWGNQIAYGEWGAFYDGTWYDYPPGYMMVLGLLTRILSMLRASSWPETMRLFAYMVPAFLADVLCGALLLTFLRRKSVDSSVALFLSALVVLNPAAIYLSGAWGQIDSILTLFLLVSLLLLSEDRRILAGIVYAVAVLMKWQALIYGPVFALLYLYTAFETEDRNLKTKRLLHTALAVAIALGILFAVSLLFKGNQPILWMVERFLGASGGYDYATVEGYNFFALLGGNWADSSLDLYRNTSAWSAIDRTHALFGKVLMAVGIPMLVIHAWRNPKSGKERGLSRELSILLATVGALIVCRILNYVLSSTKGWDVQLYAFVMTAAVVSLLYPYAASKKQSLWSYLVRNEELLYGCAAMLLGAVVFLTTITVRTVFKWFGQPLPFKAYGTAQILIACVLTALLFWKYAQKRRAGRIPVQGDWGIGALLCAFFMVWVFTFGHYMHERYIFPVLFLLLIAYAAYREKRFLLVALLFTITTFANEMIAMYVVSEGAIDMIRGGELHNAMIGLISLAEVVTALYFASVCALFVWRYDPKAEPLPFVQEQTKSVPTLAQKSKKGGMKHGKR